MNELLNGKCKQDFEKWYLNYLTDQNIHVSFEATEDVLNDFYTALPSMKWGVYVDFFLSKNITLYIVPVIVNDGTIERFDFDVDNCRYKKYFNVYSKQSMYQEYQNKARTESLKIANQLYNNENK